MAVRGALLLTIAEGLGRSPMIEDRRRCAFCWGISAANRREPPACGSSVKGAKIKFRHASGANPELSVLIAQTRLGA
jgi:hypothetical protein